MSSSAVAEANATPAAGNPVFFPHQIDAIRFAYPLLCTQKGAYIRHDTGLGKSLTAITLARLLKSERVLVVTTKGGLGVWRAEVARWWPGGFQCVTVVNYDRLSPLYVKNALRGEWGRDLLILDEAQKTKTPRAARTRAVKKLRDASERVILLSGTPAHTPLDYWAQMRLIAPDERPWCLKYSEYKEMVCKLGGPYRQWVTGFRKDKVAEVEAELGRWMHVAFKSELQLPEPIRSTVPVALSPAEQRAYQLMESRLRIELPKDRESTAPIVLTKILRLQQICSGFLTDTQGNDHHIGSSKLEALLDLLEERESQKVVVAFRYGYERVSIEAALEKLKIAHACIDGRTTDRARTGIVGAFQEGRVPVLLLQAQAGGTAITLTRADCLIKYSQIPSVIDNEQLEGRVHRIGTTTNVQILSLVASGTIDEDLLNALGVKADIVSLVSLLRRRIGRTIRWDHARSRGEGA